ncbi:hypothetical protein [Pseudoalteromonas sp. T1lg10]|uniref:hypothetical protein n=1 Tax=Pseudoalteromonas sp. T1lg10 TaxID=2077093 RepID=UPI000CF62DC7|nr:hypothetical protein [Pseudoalteromonas sp. T1lg10]
MVNKIKWNIIKSIALIIALSIVSGFLLVAAWQGWLMPLCDEPKVWFQRAGSIVTMLAVFGDLFVYRGSFGLASLSELNAEKELRSLIFISKSLVLVMPIVGTAVWGYGDLLYQCLK